MRLEMIHGNEKAFSREFQLEAVKLVKERGMSAAQAARNLDVHENVLRKWVREAAVDPQQAFPGQSVMKPEQAELKVCVRPRHLDPTPPVGQAELAGVQQ